MNSTRITEFVENNIKNRKPRGNGEFISFMSGLNV